MSRLAGATHSLLRIVAGSLFICPGGMKLLGSGRPEPVLAEDDPVLGRRDLQPLRHLLPAAL